MTHPFQSYREMNPGQKRGKQRMKEACGGAVKYATGGAIKSVKVSAHAAGGEVKAVGKASGGRLDKLARGGRTKKGGKGNHTHINIMVAPKGGADAGAGLPPDLGAGAPPMGAPPMVPKGPMGPPPGALGAGPPGMPPGMPPPKPPGMMASGGKIVALKKVPMKGGAATGEGRLDAKRAYGKNARG